MSCLPTNGPSQLLQFDNNGQLPVDLTLASGSVYTGDGSGLTDLPGGNIDAGTVNVSAINASGTPSSTTFLRGDGTWGTAVTSVGLSAPSVLAVSGSPVTGSGTLALSFATGQTANQVLATPNGTTGAVGLRSLVAADLPSAVTLQGNTFNGTSQLVQTDGTGKLPALSAANLTNIPGANITAGTVGVAAMNATGTPSSSTFLRGDGTWAPAGGGPGANGVQVFTSSGTFTVPAGITVLDVEVVGGGAGSFGANTGEAQIATGGGGGGYSRKRVSGLTSGSTITVTVGAGGSGGSAASSGGTGGTSSFGAYLSATGGISGGVGGVGSSGDINLRGESGSVYGGGASILGTGTPSLFNVGQVSGGIPSVGGNSYGGGAAGGTGTESIGTPGAAGGDGVVIVRW